MNFGEKLRHLRLKNKLTQSELADELTNLSDRRISQRIISYYEREENGAKVPPRYLLDVVSSFFDISINSLLDLDEKKTPEKILVEKIINQTKKHNLNWENFKVHNQFLKNGPYWEDKDFDGYFELESQIYKLDYEKIDWFHTYHSRLQVDEFFLISYDKNIALFIDMPDDSILIKNEQVDGLLDDLFMLVSDDVDDEKISSVATLIQRLDKLEEE